MIVDSHCHAWRYWPYEPPVPDPYSRAAVEQLLFEMDECGVEEAVLVAARIDHNPDNNDYVQYCVRRFPDRLYQFADVDCMWTPTYHTPGAAERLDQAVTTYNLRGFTHYVEADDDGSWLFSEGGQAFFRTAARGGGQVHISLDEILADSGLDKSQVAYIGDDLTDIVVMHRVGLAIATANARVEVKQEAHYVTQAEGGSGAVREAIELILKAQGVWDEILEKYEVGSAQRPRLGFNP